jgi:transcription initiation factor IIE alpha subunit
MNTLFVKALKNGFDMTKEDATVLAQTVEKVFKGSKEVEDMSLHKDVRSIFYDLHQKNLLYLRREELKEKGKLIRKYYWSFNSDGIKENAYRKPIEESPYEIYKKIPENAWLIHSSNT